MQANGNTERVTPRAPLQPRNLKLELGPDVPRYWHGGRKAVTHFFNNLSVFLPVGERFFMGTVRAYQDRVQDRTLARDVSAFHAQEGFHGREHERCNRMVAEQGYPIDAMEARVGRLLRVVELAVPRRIQLGVTCALEHFTALLADLILRHPELLEDSHPAMKDLWLWHAVEESEHKTVPYDVFQAVGGTYPERIAAMLGATVIFIAKIAEHQVRISHADGTLWTPREWHLALEFLSKHSECLLELIPKYLAYYRPGFHPSQHGDTDAVRRLANHYSSAALAS